MSCSFADLDSNCFPSFDDKNDLVLEEEVEAAVAVGVVAEVVVD